MSRIQSNVGLITGVPIIDTVEQLISISAQPRDRLSSRLRGFQDQQVALNDLMAGVIGLQFAANRLGASELYEQKSVSSSDANLISVVKTGEPLSGVYQFTPVRKASAQQFLSSGFASAEETLGAGAFSFRVGGFIDKAVDLADLNGGQGVERGRIKITDRDGESATVDLRYARSIDDVLDAINSADGIGVEAGIRGNAIQLTDTTSGGGNLKVEEVGLGNTASDLGISGINTASATATGTDLLAVFDELALDQLNDRNGVRFNDDLDDLQVDLADGSVLSVDFGDFSSAASNATGTSSATNGIDASVTFTAVGSGAEFDDVSIRFVDDASVTQGNETVVYDDTDPDNKTLTFRIDAGATTAANVVSALAGDATASQLFTAQSDGSGAGLISTVDVAVTSGGAAVAAPNRPTVGDLLRKLNEVDPSKFTAAISADGLRIELSDLTSGGNDFEVSSLYAGTTAEDLGIAAIGSGGAISGDRLMGGLKSALLGSLNGGQGFGTLGDVTVTDRSGASASVDLSAAETLDDVIAAFNASGIQISAAVNQARNGLKLIDTSRGSGTLIVSNGDATNSADALQLTTNAAVNEVNSGSLNLQVFHEGIQLETLNGGQGVDQGSFTITDSNGQTSAINLSVSKPKTVGDIIDAINALSVGVEARINDAGDGIAIVDTLGGSSRIKISDSGSSTAAADLNIAGESKTTSINGAPTEVIDGATTIRIEIEADETLQSLVDRINELDANVSASIINEGAGSKPFRLSLVSGITGSAGELLVDASSAGFQLQEVAQAQDALLLLGASNNGAGILASSTTNSFDNVLDGVQIEIENASDQPVDIKIESTDAGLLRDAKLFVSQYNTLVDKLEEYTFFSELDGSTGILFASSEALRVETIAADLVTQRHFGLGKFRSLSELGFSVDDAGKLTLDEDQLQERYLRDRDDVEEFFTKETTGFAQKANAAFERLAGIENSVLGSRNAALQAKIDTGNRRIEFLNLRLDVERESLLKTFFDLENAIAKLQSNLTAISSISALPPLTAASNR